MAKVPIQIVRFISADFPGFVAAELRDAFGNIHTFHDKVPIFLSEGYLDADSLYPQPGVLACEVVNRWTADDGRLLALIDTEKPWTFRQRSMNIGSLYWPNRSATMARSTPPAWTARVRVR